MVWRKAQRQLWECSKGSICERHSKPCYDVQQQPTGRGEPQRLLHSRVRRSNLILKDNILFILLSRSCECLTTTRLYQERSSHLPASGLAMRHHQSPFQTLSVCQHKSHMFTELLLSLWHSQFLPPQYLHVVLHLYYYKSHPTGLQLYFHIGHCHWPWGSEDGGPCLLICSLSALRSSKCIWIFNQGLLNVHLKHTI